MKKEFFVYVLRDASGKIYKGMTNNIHRRMSEHRAGKTKTTKRMKSLKLIHVEKYDTF
jgi:putative endonuclease